MRISKQDRRWRDYKEKLERNHPVWFKQLQDEGRLE